MNPVLLLVAAALSFTAKGTAAEMARDQARVIDYMLSDTPAEDLTVAWMACGQENAFFYPRWGPIVLCLELHQTPAPIFAAAHEAGHALVYALELAIDKDETANERAADELAALFLIEMDRADDVVGGAKWFMQHPDAPGDNVHPQHRVRAWELLCLVSGSEPTGSLECKMLYRMVWTRWAIALTAALGN